MLILAILITSCSNPCATGFALNENGQCIPFALDTSGSENYHPDGYDDPNQHSIDAKLGASICTECHGVDLTGAENANNCDQCHTEGWRTNCTFCHGGSNNNSGAPPRDLDGSETDASFGVHSTHVNGNDHMDYDCSECHKQPDEALSQGHMFDATPSVAEVEFNPNMNPEATWNNDSCSNLYCHSNAQGGLGSVNTSDEVKCGDCHSGPNSEPSAWLNMSGEHAEHLLENVHCSDCHERTINQAGEFTNASLHVNGTVNVSIPSLTYTDSSPEDPMGATCEGICHSETHDMFAWEK